MKLRLGFVEDVASRVMCVGCIGVESKVVKIMSQNVGSYDSTSHHRLHEPRVVLNKSFQSNYNRIVKSRG